MARFGFLFCAIFLLGGLGGCSKLSAEYPVAREKAMHRLDSSSSGQERGTTEELVDPSICVGQDCGCESY